MSGVTPRDAFEGVFAYESKSHHISKDYKETNCSLPYGYIPIVGPIFIGFALIKAKPKFDLKDRADQADLARLIIIFSGLGPLLILVDAIATAMLHCDKKYKH